MAQRELPTWARHIWDELTRPPALLQSRSAERRQPSGSKSDEEPTEGSRGPSLWQHVRDLLESPTDPPTVGRTPSTTASQAKRMAHKYFTPKRTQRKPATKPRPRLKTKAGSSRNPGKAGQPETGSTRSLATTERRIGQRPGTTSVLERPRSSAAEKVEGRSVPMSIEQVNARMDTVLDGQVVLCDAVDSVWRLQTSSGKQYALKATPLSPARIDFMAQALDYVWKNGFTHVSRIIRTRSGEPYWRENGKLFYLSEWQTGARAQFGSTRQVGATARATARLHEVSRRFEPTADVPPTAGDVFGQLLARKQELQHMLIQLEQSAEQDDYDRLATTLLARANQQASEALSLLKLPEAETSLAQSAADPGLCHLDVTRRNVIVHPQGHAQLIDFDRMTYGPRVLDLGHLIRRAMQAHGTWTSEIAIAPLLAYNRVRPLTPGEYMVLEGLLLFPHRLWRLLLQYYDNPPSLSEKQEQALQMLRDTQTQEDERARFMETFARQVTRRGSR